jgi:hypothetical protein
MKARQASFLNTASAESKGIPMSVIEFMVKIAVNVHDEAALHQQAVQIFEKDGMTKNQALDLVGGGDKPIQLADCLIAVFDPGESPAGTTIVETTVEHCSSV